MLTPTPKKSAIKLMVVDSQSSTDSVTLPGLRTLPVGVALAGIPRQKLEDGLVQFFGDRFSVEEVPVAEAPES